MPINMPIIFFSAGAEYPYILPSLHVYVHYTGCVRSSYVAKRFTYSMPVATETMQHTDGQMDGHKSTVLLYYWLLIIAGISTNISISELHALAVITNGTSH